MFSGRKGTLSPHGQAAGPFGTSDTDAEQVFHVPF